MDTLEQIRQALPAQQLTSINRYKAIEIGNIASILVRNKVPLLTVSDFDRLYDMSIQDLMNITRSTYRTHREKLYQHEGE